MTVRAILQRKGDNVVNIAPGATVADAVALLAQCRIGAVPVVEAGRVLGVFSERDVIHGLAAHGASALEACVADAMTAPALSVSADDPVLAALSLMTRRRIRHLPVLDGDALIGFISIGDLVAYRIDRIEDEAAALRDYIASA